MSRYPKHIIYTLTLLIGLMPLLSLAQSPDEPDDFLSREFHQDRRDQVRNRMPENSVAVVFSNPVRNRANDVDYVYHQDPNFYYLTGYREPHSVLLIFKEDQRDDDGTAYNEIIFVQPRNPTREQWDGRRLGTAGVKDRIGILQAFANSDFKNYNLDFSSFDKVLFYDFQNDVRDTNTEGDLYDLIDWFKVKAGYPDPMNPSLSLEPRPQNLDTQSLDDIMHLLRGVKTEEELALLQKAVDISCIGQVEVMKAMKPGMSEREIQGIHEFVFRKYQAEYQGYPSIVGAGHNGCILHYIDNYKPEVESDELILMDLGAEYHGYTADVTRTIPISGKFSPEQKIIYDIVYEAQEAAIQACAPGVSFGQLSQIARDIVTRGLLDNGIITEPGQNRIYYPHGLSHHIGLDVHDKGLRTLEPNMALTVEPGIYIPPESDCDPKWWGIAVRIEDDVLITEDGFVLMSDMAPRTTEEIEAMMEQPSALEDFVLPVLDKE